MNTSTNKTFRWSQILHLPVLNQNSNEEIGKVCALWTDLCMAQIIGFSVKKNRFEKESQQYSWRQVVSVSSNQIVIAAIEESEAFLSLHTEYEILSHVDTQIHYNVWLYSGEFLGHINDYCFDPTTGNVVTYLGQTERFVDWQKHPFHLNPKMVIDMGRGWLLVSNRAIEAIDIAPLPKRYLHHHFAIAVS